MNMRLKYPFSSLHRFTKVANTACWIFIIGIDFNALGPRQYDLVIAAAEIKRCVFVAISLLRVTLRRAG